MIMIFFFSMDKTKICPAAQLDTTALRRDGGVEQGLRPPRVEDFAESKEVDRGSSIAEDLIK